MSGRLMWFRDPTTGRYIEGFYVGTLGLEVRGRLVPIPPGVQPRPGPAPFTPNRDDDQGRLPWHEEKGE